MTAERDALKDFINATFSEKPEDCSMADQLGRVTWIVRRLRLWRNADGISEQSAAQVDALLAKIKRELCAFVELIRKSKLSGSPEAVQLLKLFEDEIDAQIVPPN